MIFAALLLGLVQSSTENQTQLIVTYSDIEYLAQIEILERPKADEVWQVLISQAEKTDPSRISVAGFNVMPEHYIFGVIPTISIITSLGALSILLLLLFLFNAVESTFKSFAIIAYTGLACFISVSVSIALYEACGVIFVTWLLMMLGLFFLFICLQQIFISIGLLKAENDYESFNKYLALIALVFVAVGYYCSLQISFPLFQLPFFVGLWYLVGFFQTILQGKYKQHASILAPLTYLATSALIIIYTIAVGQLSFVLTKNSAFVDFRFFSLFSSSIAFFVSLPIFLYKLYCKLHEIEEETISVIFKKYLTFQVSHTWTDVHTYVLCNFIGMLGLLFLGFLIRSSPLIVLGYLGCYMSILGLPISKFSNFIYHLMYLNVFFVTAILGYLSDPSFSQFLVFYPSSYLLSIGYLILRIILILIGLIICSKYRTTHFSSHSSFDFFLDFAFNYAQTVMLIVFSEVESNFLMSWAYFIILFIQLEPMAKFEPESFSDNVIKAFSMLLFALRLITVGYSSWIISANSILIVLIGLFHLSSVSSKAKYLKIAFYAYFYLCIQISCCFSSWTLVIIFCVATNLRIDHEDLKKSTVSKSVLLGLLIFVFSFFLPISNFCSATCHSYSMCSLLVNPDGNMIEKVVLKSFLEYLNGSLG